MLNQDPKRRTLDIEALKLAYFPVPKVASTSVKQIFHTLQYGAAFKPKKGDPIENGIHSQYFFTQPFFSLDLEQYKNFARIAIIRDPAARILSAYSNRVVQHGELSESNIDMELAEKLGVKPDPKCHKFLANIDAYRLLSKSINHHTAPFTHFLGSDMGFFTDVYKINQLDRLTKHLRKLSKQKVEIEHYNDVAPAEKQLGIRRPTLAGLGVKARENLLKYCAGDYALLKDYFPIPDFRK